MFSAAAVRKLWQVQIELLNFLLVLLSQAAALQRNWNKKEMFKKRLHLLCSWLLLQHKTRSYPSKCKYILYKVLSHLLTKPCFLPDVVAPLHFNQCLSSTTWRSLGLWPFNDAPGIFSLRNKLLPGCELWGKLATIFSSSICSCHSFPTTLWKAIIGMAIRAIKTLTIYVKYKTTVYVEYSRIIIHAYKILQIRE